MNKDVYNIGLDSGMLCVRTVAVNSVFGKVGRIASEEVVILYLVKYKCMFFLFYDFEVLNLNQLSHGQVIHDFFSV